MNRRRLLILSSFFIFVALVMTLLYQPLNNVDINENEDIKLLSDTGEGTDSTEITENIDVSIPVVDNSLKTYQSNIPDDFYDASKNYGVNSDGTSEIYIDFISEDGKTNYAYNYNPDEVPIIEIPYDYTNPTDTNFYVDFGYMNYTSSSSQTTADRYEFSMYSDIATVNITQDTKTLFTSEIGNLYNFYNDYTAGATTRLTYDENSNITLNSEYRLHKITFTPETPGYAMVNINPAYVGSGFPDTCEFKFLLHVYDVDYHYGFDFDGISISSLEYYEQHFSLKDDNVRNNGIPILQETFTYFELQSDPNFQIYDYANEFLDCIFYSLSDSLEIDDDYVYIYESGIHEISLLTVFTLMYPTYYDGTDFTSYESYEIKEIFRFKINAYTPNDLIVDAGLTTETGDLVYLEEGQTYDLTIPKFENNTYIDVKYKLNDVESTGEISNLAQGEYKYEIIVTNNLADIETNRVISIKVNAKNDLHQAPKLDTENSLTYTTEDTSIHTINLTNYSYVSQFADLSINPIQGELTYELVTDGVSGRIDISQVPLGVNVIEIVADYGSTTKSTFVTITGVNQFEYALDKTELEMSTNSSSSITFGYLLDGVFSRFSEDELNKYQITGITSDSDILTIATNADTLTFTSNENSGSLACNIAVLSQGGVICVFNVNVIIIGEDNIVFALDKEDIEMSTNSTDSIYLGYLSNDVFTRFTASELGDYKLFVTTSNSNIVSVSTDSDTILITSRDLVGTVSCNIGVMYDDVIVTIFNVNVSVKEYNYTDTTITFKDGSLYNILLNDNFKTITLTIDLLNASNYSFKWYSLDSKIATVSKLTSTTALVTGISAGTTEIIAISQDENGANTIAYATINVLDAEPTVSLSFDKEDNRDSAFTIYDLINVKINSNGFYFSSMVTYKWYLNGAVINIAYDKSGNNIAVDSKTTELYLKLPEGLQTIKVEVEDPTYNLELSTTSELKVSKEEYQDRALSFEDTELYLATTGSDYQISVLLDGVINTYFEYTWWMDDSKIATIFMSDDNTALIRPVAAGETTLNVMTNVGKYEDKIISAQITIFVEVITTIEVSPINEYNKPGDTIEAEILLNGKTTFKNYTPKLEITADGVAIDYELDGSKIIIENAPKSKLKISATYNSLSSAVTLDVTNFNVKQFILTILPYLIIAAVVFTAIFTIFKVNSNPFKNAVKAVEKINKATDEALAEIKKSNDEKNVKKQYHKLLKQSYKLLKTLTYYYDEGIDEFRFTISKAASLVKIMQALLRSNNGTTNALKIIYNVKKQQVLPITGMINETIAARKKYQEIVAKNNSQEAKKVKSKKHKMTKDEYVDYLQKTGIMNLPDDDDFDSE